MSTILSPSTDETTIENDAITRHCAVIFPNGIKEHPTYIDGQGFNCADQVQLHLAGLAEGDRSQFIDCLASVADNQSNLQSKILERLPKPEKPFR